MVTLSRQCCRVPSSGKISTCRQTGGNGRSQHLRWHHTICGSCCKVAAKPNLSSYDSSSSNSCGKISCCNAIFTSSIQNSWLIVVFTELCHADWCQSSAATTTAAAGQRVLQAQWQRWQWWRTSSSWPSKDGIQVGRRWHGGGWRGSDVVCASASQHAEEHCCKTRAWPVGATLRKEEHLLARFFYIPKIQNFVSIILRIIILSIFTITFFF